MTENVTGYIIMGVVALLAVFSFVVGLEKMIKIVLGNYILGSICMATSQSIDLFVNYLNTMPESTAGGLSYTSLAVFFSSGKTTIVLILYVILLVVIYKTSKIHVSIPEDPAVNKLLYVFFVPLTVLSMILALQIAILGINVINIQQLQSLATGLTQNVYIYNFITMTPVRILLHGIATVLITSELKIGVKTGV